MYKNDGQVCPFLGEHLQDIYALICWGKAYVYCREKKEIGHGKE